MPEEKYMRRAIELAKKGSGHVNPNPLVGAVIVKDGEIIGEGYHECYGQLHAERNAIANARKRGNNIEGSTIYVLLRRRLQELSLVLMIRIRWYPVRDLSFFVKKESKLSHISSRKNVMP